jgi:hypothetical protein
MTAARKRQERGGPIAFATGIVVGTVSSLSVSLDGETVHSERAKSCLVVPELGDEVLCARGTAGVYVLAVLRGRRTATTVRAAGDLALEAPRGRIAMAAAEGVDLTSPGAVTLHSDELSIRARRGKVAVEHLGYFGRLVEAQAGKLTWLAREVDGVVDRLVQRARSVFRQVDELEQARVGSLDVRAEGLAAIRGENSVLSARIVAKIDAEQVHIG